VRSTDTAERLLSWATTSERAANIAGDLSEQATARGLVWFWCSLSSITLSLVWRAWADAPFRMLRLGAVAWILATGFQLVLVLTLAGATSIGGVMAFFVASWSVAASQFHAGRWLARRAPERELAACTAFLFIDLAFWASIAIVLLRIQPSQHEPSSVLLDGIVGGASSVFLLLGAARGQASRRQHPIVRSGG
jgi:hypothetical protein